MGRETSGKQSLTGSVEKKSYKEKGAVRINISEGQAPPSQVKDESSRQKKSGSRITCRGEKS